MNWLKNTIGGILGGFGVIGAIVFVGLIACIGGICMHYDINTIQVLTHHHVTVGTSFWIICLILGFFLSQITIPVAVCLWLLMLFM